MANDKSYTLPQLKYDYGELKAFLSEQQLMLHHQKHHQSYVDNSNAILEKLDKARQENIDLDLKAVLKELSFNLSGHILHSIFWEIMAPSSAGGGGEPGGELAEAIRKEFGSFARFKKEFSQTAISCEGSGWAVLCLDWQTGRPMLIQIEKHNLNLFPAFRLLMVLDVWEHAYYLDYKNERVKFVEAFWQVVNWREIGQRYKKL